MNNNREQKPRMQISWRPVSGLIPFSAQSMPPKPGVDTGPPETARLNAVHSTTPIPSQPSAIKRRLITTAKIFTFVVVPGGWLILAWMERKRLGRWLSRISGFNKRKADTPEPESGENH